MANNTDTTNNTLGDESFDPDAHLLEVDNLHVEFRIEDGVVKAVNGLTYTLDQHETLAILGESGSGKSVSAQAVMGILDTPPGFVTQGSVKFKGVDLLELPEKVMAKQVRGQKIAMIFQDALTSLNPVFTVGWQIGEMLRKHRGLSKKEAKEQAIDLMERVRIPDARQRVNAYPHEFSGGMRQRAMIAMALSLDPDVLIADEPTTALDVTVQAQIMELLHDLQRDTGMGLILITHDLGVVAEVCDRVVVMYAGEIMEDGEINDVYHHPAHPYTLGLMDSIPRTDMHTERLMPIQGTPPDLLNIPSGCPFNPRCPFAQPRCTTDKIERVSIGQAGHESSCFYWEEVQRDR